MITSPNDLLGKTLGTCRLQRLLGRGGMGAVYLAQQSRPRRTVAVKVLLPSLVLEQQTRIEFVTRFRREADAIAALDHINIMPVYEYGEQDDIAYLVMPYVTGGTLREVLEKRSILPLGEIIPIIEQAAAALECAHAQGIVHRDLKPANMLFHTDGRVLLADFGLAKVLKDVEEWGDSNGYSALTSAGTIVGTPEYLSPEQGTGQFLDHRTDIYSLGIVLYQMISGRMPFTGPSPVAIAIKHAMEEAPSLPQFNPTVSPEIEAVVKKAMMKDPALRYYSAGELARALRSANTSYTKQELINDYQTPITLMSNDTQPEVPSVEAHEPAAQKTPPPDEDIHEVPTEETPRVGEDIHGSPTEETPRVGEEDTQESPTEQTAQSPEQVIDLPTIISPEQPQLHVHKPAAEIAPHPVDASPKAALAHAVLADEAPMTPLAPQRPPERPASRSGRRPPGWIALAGGLLALLLIVAGVATFVHNTPTTSLLSHAIVTPITHTSTKGTVTSQPKTVAQLPEPLVKVGTMIYGTNLPGASCDPQGGQWSNSSNIKLTCGKTATQVMNTGSTRVGGTFLNQMPNKQFPDNYIIQVQFTVASDSKGPFGVFFRNQAGGQQGAGAFLINPANATWGGYTYDSSTGTVTPLVQRPLQSQVSGTVTIDISVQGETFGFYVNGLREGGAESQAYASGGTIGLAADVGADVSFKNLAIYTMP